MKRSKEVKEAQEHLKDVQAYQKSKSKKKMACYKNDMIYVTVIKEVSKT